MLKDLHTLTPYLDFIRTCNADPDYRDPMLLTQQQLHRNLLDAPENPNTRVFGTFEGEAITGVFALLVLEDERYLELLAGLSRSAAAYAELLSHLKSAHPGYQADFVYNPRNRLLQEALAALGAEFEPEQQKSCAGLSRMCRMRALCPIVRNTGRSIWRCTPWTAIGRAKRCWPRRRSFAFCLHSKPARFPATST
mgnify:CR=1 FL=1